jgi:hypothetical protein
MHPFRTALLALAGLVAATPTLAPASAAPAPRATLAAYADDDALAAALDRWRARAELERRARQRSVAPAGSGPALAEAQSMPAPAAAAAAPAADAAASITNVQVAGVDEGGIVKAAGEHLVILRRGRLFTVRVGGDALRPVAAVDVAAPGADPRGTWYDELLVSGRDVVVVGWSAARGGTELALFSLGDDGALAYRATWHLRSDDYWSSRNYASRLVGRTLVFYSPMRLSPWGPSPLQRLPALRRWDAGATPAGFERILPAARIHRTDDELDPRQPLALHTVTRCELGDATLRCEATAVLGPAGRVFHVARDAVYVWTSAGSPAPPHGDGHRPTTATSAVFRIPLDGGAPAALKTVGVPVDTQSFRDDGRGRLDVLLRAGGPGEAMWGAPRARGSTALLSVPIAAFGDGRDAAGPEHYRVLPAPRGVLHNRWIGPWLLWGGAAPASDAPTAWALRADDPRAEPVGLDPGHGVERIEALGAHALLVGAGPAGLHFGAVRLEGATAALAGRHLEAGARQGETRTHAFFHRVVDADGNGIVALPTVRTDTGAPPRAGQGAAGAAVLFLAQRTLGFAPLGALQAGASQRPDGCRVSCVDWYGNARPVFVGERIFALLGYELVEGRLTDAAGDGREPFDAYGAPSRGAAARLVERRRIDFGPRGAGGRWSPFD